MSREKWEKVDFHHKKLYSFKTRKAVKKSFTDNEALCKFCREASRDNGVIHKNSTSGFPYMAIPEMRAKME